MNKKSEKKETEELLQFLDSILAAFRHLAFGKNIK
jgi:hypothetical protein